MQTLIQEAIRGSRFNRTELARRAGVSASTISRIEKGSIDPTLGMAEKILAATGLQIAPRLEPLSDPEALRAARAILGDDGDTAADTEGAATLRRWASPDGTPRPRALAREAGAAAPPRLRPGAVELSTGWNFLRICSTVAATREGWAVSGSPAAERIGAPEATGPVILYVQSPQRIERMLASSGPGPHQVLILPFDGTSETGAWNDEGIVWADPIQVILDCYGLPEATGQAEELTKDWERQ